MKLWNWFSARRQRKANERRLAERLRDDAAPWGTDPNRAIRDAGQKVAGQTQPYNEL